MEPDSPVEEKWLTIKELAAVIDCSTDKVRARLKSKKWPSWRDGRTIRFTPEHVQAIKDVGQVSPRRGRISK